MAKADRRKKEQSKYRDDIHIPWAEALARGGATNADIAQAFGISENTLYRWQRRHKPFAQALKLSKSQSDALIVDALYRRATGQLTKRTVKTRYQVDEYGNETVLYREVTEEQIPPDMKAIAFWLVNRCPDMWRNDPRPDDCEPAVLVAARELVMGVNTAIE